MTEELKKLLSQLGISGDYLKNLTAETPAEDFDPAAAYDAYSKSRKAVLLKSLKPEIDAKIEAGHKVAQKTFAKKVAKALDLELTGSEAEKAGLDGVLALVPDRIKAIEETAAGQTDAELRNQLQALKDKIQESTTALSTANADFETKLQRVEREKQEAIHERDLRDLFQLKFDKIKYGATPEHVKLFKESAKRKIADKYKIEKDGTIFDKDGTSAINFEENGTYATLDEAILYLATEANVLEKSKGGTGGNGLPGGPAGKTTTDKMSSAAKQMLDRMRQQADKNAKRGR